MTVLSIIRAVAGRLSLPRPTVVVTSTDQQVIQLFELLTEECEDLSKAADWQALMSEWTFITVAAEAQTNTPIPPDFKRSLPDSFFNRTAARKLIGPITPQQWQAIKALSYFSNIYISYRVRDGVFLMAPAPAAGQTVAYEYVSSYWAQSSAGVPKAGFTSDDDGTYLDEELVKLGLRWRWKAAKGLPYAEDMASYERAKQEAAGNDGGAGQLDMGGDDYRLAYDRANIPEGSFGV